MKWIATSPNAAWREKVPQPTEALPQISVTGRRQQAIDGFGGCFNELGWQVLQALSEERRAHLMRDLFDPAGGCGYRLCRVPVGANDYALEWYSHNEHEGDFAMKHFSIERDHRYLIPYVRAALSIQPDLHLFASPWSPPTWMKQPEIWAGTIESPDYDAWAHTLLLDPAARAFVSGVGYQWAGKGALQQTHQSWPELRLLLTECECGDGSNTWEYAHYVFTLLHHYLSNGANGFVYWNMVLPPGGKSSYGWSQNSMITVEATLQTVAYNPEFYVMKHFAHFVTPGSVRVDLHGPWSGNALAFHTPDHSTVAVCANQFPGTS